MPVNKVRMQRTASSQTNLTLLNGDALKRLRSERFVYRELTLPPQIWVRLYDDLGKVVEESLSSSDGVLVFRWDLPLRRTGKKDTGKPPQWKRAAGCDVFLR